MGFFSSSDGDPEAQPTPRPVVPRDLSIIDYVHESDGVFHHGTFSLIDGDVRATWTKTDESGSKQSSEMAMSEETFCQLWDAINDIPDFETGIVREPDQSLDPVTCHVIGIIYDFDGQQGQRTHMIPADTTSPAFAEWLRASGYAGK